MNTQANQTLTLVMRVGTTEKDIQNYVFISDTYAVVTLSTREVVDAINNKKAVFNNVGISDKGIVSTNGAITNYTLFNPETNEVIGESKAVVIDRVEREGKLVGYTIFNKNGILQEVTVDQAVQIEKKSVGFANGKIRHTNSGDIISSIAGNFNLKTLSSVKTEPALNLTVVFFGSAIKSKPEAALKYVGLIVECDNAAALSKVYGMIEKDNSDLRNSMNTLANNSKESDHFKLIRTNKAGVYGVLSFKAFESLLEKANKEFRSVSGTLTIACTDLDLYDDDDDGVESSITLDSSNKPVRSTKGSNRSNAALKSYTDEVLKLAKNHLKA